MAKKTDIKNKLATPAPPAAPAKRATKATSKPKAAAAGPKLAAEKQAATNPKSTAAKAKPAPKKTAKPKSAAYTNDDVARRAYFISEKRRAHGLPGDEHQDWIEAERQLATESKKPRKA